MGKGYGFMNSASGALVTSKQSKSLFIWLSGRWKHVCNPFIQMQGRGCDETIKETVQPWKQTNTKKF